MQKQRICLTILTADRLPIQPSLGSAGDFSVSVIKLIYAYRLVNLKQRKSANETKSISLNVFLSNPDSCFVIVFFCVDPVDHLTWLVLRGRGHPQLRRRTPTAPKVSTTHSQQG